jgi:single-stranded-DNA-specific exonuclease
LASRLGVSTVVGQLLLNRGISDEAAARQFLNGGLEGLHDPFLFKGMDAAVERTAAALSAKEKITIYGDYDVDGITATSLLYNILREFGATVEYYIPERQSEGYGLNVEALEKIAASGTGLLITVDCGISAYQEVRAVPALDIIITDHHQPPEVLPVAVAVVNPKQPGCPYPEKELAGVGIAFKFCQALSKRLGARLDCLYYLDIVAIGTVADMVPLTGENRLLVKYGIDRLRQTDNLGLQALLSACELQSATIDAGKIGFVIAPRLNASGRLNHAAAGVELLTSLDPEKVQTIAVGLNLTNTERQEVERQIVEKAEETLKDTDWSTVKALVVAGSGWHSGVIGIVASRLVERYYRPTVLISVQNGVGKGSCRSIPGFDMYAGLQSCSELLLQFGGHHQAAGLSINEADIPAFSQKLNAIAGKVLSADDFFPVLNIDTMVSLGEVNTSLIEQMACLEPFGMGNPSPLLACSPVELQSSSAFGKEKRHLRLWIRENTVSSEVIAWNKGELAAALDCKCPAEIAFVPEIHEWQGRSSVRMRAVDVRKTGCDLPDKQAVGKLYLLLKGLCRSGGKYPAELSAEWNELSHRLATHYCINMDEAEIAFSIAVLEELGLISIQRQTQTYQIIVLPPPDQKLDILASATYRTRQK